MQKYKNIYFSDFPAETSQQKNITLAFGEKDWSLYKTIRPLSSQNLREVLGYSSYSSLEDAAKEKKVSINSYCIDLLSSRFLDADRKLGSFVDHNVKIPAIDPLQATFKGGKNEPLHRWYPYLEGYSPKFVQQILKSFAPSARSVLDPFAGTGTTPITVAQLGLSGFYTELNPLMQTLIDSKILALTIGKKSSTDILSKLGDLKTNLAERIELASADLELDYSYKRVFGKSIFFDDHTYRTILKTRSLVDKLSGSDPKAAKLFNIAVLSSLIPSSKLIRRGDLRYKNDNELKKKTPTFLDSVTTNLDVIIEDIKKLENISKLPILITENAKFLEKIPSIGIDAIVTSPPYLNGTNYFRNTKIELWFLRCLKSKEDLAKYRFKAVTSGINDVTVKKKNDAVVPLVQDLVDKLAKTSYDKRIPQMVANYFMEMSDIFCSLKPHLYEKAIVAVDIGDSSYGGVHVPTDKMLVDIFSTLEFDLEKHITLRKRLSRNGFPLSQSLLLFRYKKKKKKKKKNKSKRNVSWKKDWRDFKSNLPHQKDEFAKRNWGNALHSLCSYQGKMKPSIAYHLIETFVPKNGRLLDPFSGVGTIPFEAALNGIKSFAFEISPLALKVTQAKLGKHNPATCEKIIFRLENYIEENKVLDFEKENTEKIRFNGQLENYFNEKTFEEIILARRFFHCNPLTTASECLVFSSLLHILHGNRPYALSRNSHPITPFAPTGSYEYRALIPRLREKVERSLNAGLSDNFVEGRVFHQDATSWWNQEVCELDAVITSPPFFNSTRFYLANWMRLWFCGWESRDFQSKPHSFVDEKQKLNLNIYNWIFRQARERLKKNGVLVLHLGKSKKCDMASELSKLAKHWFRVADIFDETVGHCESHGVRDKGTVTSHQYLVLS